MAAGRAAGPSLFQPPTDVVEFDPETFPQVVMADSRVWIVDYYADWCGHCQHYAPIYSRIATAFKEEPRVKLGSLNCAQYSGFCSHIEVHSFPTVRAYHWPSLDQAETKHGYELPRPKMQEKELTAWIEEQLLHVPVAESSKSNDGAAAKADGVAVPSERSASVAILNRTAGGSSSSTSLPAKVWYEDVAHLHLMDAEVAILYSLHQGVPLAAQPLEEAGADPPDDVIAGEALTELISWLDFLGQVFPNRQLREDVRTLAADIHQLIDDDGLRLSAWNKVIDGRGLGHAPAQAGKNPSPFWRLCKTYTCGLWTIFHIVTMVVAEGKPSAVAASLTGAAGFLTSGVHTQHSPADALTHIRSFVKYLFGCSQCVENFLATYDGCDLGRCELAPSDGKGYALWLWQVHNGVSLRVNQAQPWPATNECRTCWPNGQALENSGYHPDLDAVYDHLRLSYIHKDWQFAQQDDASLTTVIGVGLACLTIALLSYVVWLALRGVIARQVVKKGS